MIRHVGRVPSKRQISGTSSFRVRFRVSHERWAAGNRGEDGETSPYLPCSPSGSTGPDTDGAAP